MRSGGLRPALRFSEVAWLIAGLDSQHTQEKNFPGRKGMEMMIGQY